MKIGCCIEGYGRPEDFQALIGKIVQAEKDGYQSIWFGGANEPLITCAVAGRETSRVEMMSAIIVSYPRHPATLANEALTTNAALGGRFVLGIGPASRPNMARLGFDYDRAADHMREYVTVVKDLIDGNKVDFEGEFYKADTAINLPWALNKSTTPPPDPNNHQPLPVLMSALGPRMLKAAGDVSDGTVTWMVGVKTLENFVAPRIRQAAATAARPAPRISVGLPVAVCDDAKAGREIAATTFKNYGSSPHYSRMIKMEGSGIEDVVVCGTETEVESQIHALVSAGATEFYAYPFAVGDNSAASLTRTNELVTSLAGKL